MTRLEKLASTEKLMTNEEVWLKGQIEKTFARVARGDNIYYSEDEAEERMKSFIAANNAAIGAYNSIKDK